MTTQREARPGSGAVENAATGSPALGAPCAEAHGYWPPEQSAAPAPGAAAAPVSRRVAVTGASGFIGRALVPALVDLGHAVRVLARVGNGYRPPPAVDCIRGDALDGAALARLLVGAHTLVHLVGVSHPGPAKAAQFRSLDLASIRLACAAAQRAGVRHLVYLSVARPAPVMRAYQAARAQGEATISATSIPATFVRPWYVLGPGRRWPLALLPLWWAMERMPATRQTAQRLGLVTRAQMVAALLAAVETPPPATRVFDVVAIRAGAAAPRVCRDAAAAGASDGEVEEPQQA